MRTRSASALIAFCCAAAMSLPACYAAIMRSELEKYAAQINSAGVELYVYKPELLRAVKSVALGEFKVEALAGHPKAMRIYEGSGAAGQASFVDENAGPLVSEVYQGRLLRATEFHVTERQRLKRLMAERALQMNGIVENKDTVDAMTVAGVDALLFGTVSNSFAYMPDDPTLVSMLILNVRLTLIDVRTGSVILMARDRHMTVEQFFDEEGEMEASADRFVRVLTLAKQQAASASEPFLLKAPIVEKRDRD